MKTRETPLCWKTEIEYSSSRLEGTFAKRVNLLAKREEGTHVEDFREHVSQLFFSGDKVKVNVLVKNKPAEVVLPPKEVRCARLNTKFL